MANIKNRTLKINEIIVSEDGRRAKILGTYNKEKVVISKPTTDQWAHLGIRRAL